jgi:hypothetical protein
MTAPQARASLRMAAECVEALRAALHPQQAAAV